MGDLIRLDPSLLSEEAKRLNEFLRSKIISQELAIERLVKSYSLGLSPLKNPEQPIFSGLFLGPSGVGKTHTAEMLAEYFCGSKTGFTKIECANYTSQYELNKLIGSAAGYVGYWDPADPNQRGTEPLLSQGKINAPYVEVLKKKLLSNDQVYQDIKKKRAKLLEKYFKAKGVERDNLGIECNNLLYRMQWHEYYKLIKEKIFSIILFDEIEKAHPALLNFLLEIVSKGRTKLSNGMETIFLNSFIFMTSNVGSGDIANTLKGKGSIGFGAGKQNESYYGISMENLERLFRPEFIGRIKDNIVVFKPLSKEQLAQILDLKLAEMVGQLTQGYPLTLVVENEVKTFILEKSSDHPEFGARPLADKIKKYLHEPLAAMIGSGQIARKDKVCVKLVNGEVVFLKEPSPPPTEREIKIVVPTNEEIEKFGKTSESDQKDEEELYIDFEGLFEEEEEEEPDDPKEPTNPEKPKKPDKEEPPSKK